MCTVNFETGRSQRARRILSLPMTAFHTCWSCSSSSTSRIGPQPRLQLALPLAPRWKCPASLRTTGPSRGWTASRRGSPTVHAHARGFCLSCLCRCTHDLLPRPPPSDTGSTSQRLSKIRARRTSVTETKLKPRGARQNCGYEIKMQNLRERSTSKPKPEHILAVQNYHPLTRSSTLRFRTSPSLSKTPRR